MPLVTDCYVFLLAKAYQKGQRRVQRRLRPYGLTNLQYLVLEILWARKGLTAVELGTALRIDKATLSGILERMFEAGWLTRWRDARDKRMIRLYASTKAEDLKATLISERRLANEELLAAFDENDREALRRLLEKMIDTAR